MKWEGRRQSNNIEDKRSSSPGGGGTSSMGAVMMIWSLIRPLLRTKFGWVLIFLGVLAYMNGFNPLSILGIGEQGNTQIVDQAKDDRQAAFISTVLADIEEVWKETLPEYGIRYKEPKVVLYRNATQSGCGFASAQMGPFYCPADQKVYLDLGFFDELAKRHGAPGDFAQAYVLAHEIGHHIQNLQGTLDKVQQAKQQWGNNSVKANALQVRVELQADCYAGAWAYHAQKRFDILEPGDVEEALKAASAIGDDTLQKKAQGYVVPDAFTHGSSKQREEWFRRGFQNGDLRECNTF